MTNPISSTVENKRERKRYLTQQEKTLAEVQNLADAISVWKTIDI